MMSQDLNEYSPDSNQQISVWNIDQLLSEIKAKYEEKEYSEKWKTEGPLLEIALHLISDEMQSDYESPTCRFVEGSRVVIKITHKTTEEEFALKVCRPFPQAIPAIAAEMEKISDLDHPNLVRVHKSGSVKIPDLPGDLEELPFTLEDWVKRAQQLNQWLSSLLDNCKSAKDLMDTLHKLHGVLTDLLLGIGYLHNNGLFHRDIKPENILITDDSPRIIDFGYSIRLYHGTQHFDSRTESKIGFTWKYALPELRKHITNMDNPDAAYAIPLEDISPLRIDKYSLGRTIEECLLLINDRLTMIIDEAQQDKNKIEGIENCLYWIEYMGLVAMRLKGKDSFEDMDDFKSPIVNYPPNLIEDIQFPNVNNLIPMASVCLKRLVIRNLAEVAPEWDPLLLHSIRVGLVTVPFTPRLRRLFNHPSMARLSRVTQLGLVAFVYPGARHTRLEHCMGTYYYSLRYLAALWAQQDEPILRCLATPEEIIAASLAALFHDLGQYPHCHDLEDALPGLQSHSDLASAIYRGVIGPPAEKSLADLVEEDWGPVVAAMVDFYLTPSEEKLDTYDAKRSILLHITKSPIDADKLDYVQRDSNNLGLPYGLKIDMDRLISTLRPLVISESGELSEVVLGVNHKGILAAQSLVVAREQLYERAYWHKTVRAFKAMLGNSLRSDSSTIESVKELIDAILQNPSENADIVEDSTGVSWHLSEGDVGFLLKLKNVLTTPESQTLIERILRREPYRVWLELSSGSNVKQIRDAYQELIKLTDAVYSFPFIVRVLEDTRSQLEKLVLKELPATSRAKLDKYKQLHVLLDVPRPKLKQSKVRYYDPATETIQSVVLGFLDQGTAVGWMKAVVPRVYVSPELMVELKKHLPATEESKKHAARLLANAINQCIKDVKQEGNM